MAYLDEKTQSGFSQLGVIDPLVELLNKHHLLTPTPIQTQAIPIAIEGKDLVGIAQTGTGKTLAFGIPMIQRLAQMDKKGLVIVPTRELALQVDESLLKIGRGINLQTAVLIGGTSKVPQLRMISRNPQVIIATPGRLIDHLELGSIRLHGVGVVVLDEADRMLDMGFFPQIEKIFRELPKERQTMLFSATMPMQIMQMATAYMKLPIRVEIAPAGTTAERVTQELFIVPQVQKVTLLEKVLQQYTGQTLVFTRTKYGAERIRRAINDMGVKASEIHSNRSLSQRRESLEGFKRGKYRVLVATDIASRGIDVKNIDVVINYDLPTNSDDYVHRIGRTARAGAGGHAITFAMPNEERAVRAIERLTRKQLPVSEHPQIPKTSFTRMHHANHNTQPFPGRKNNRRYSSPRRRSSR